MERDMCVCVRCVFFFCCGSGGKENSRYTKHKTYVHNMEEKVEGERERERERERREREKLIWKRTR